MKVSVIAFGAARPIILNTVEGVRRVDEVLRDTGKTYRLSSLTTLRKLTLRGASPQIITGARQSLSIGIILMVISEMFAATNGLGFTTIQFQRTFAIPEMWTGILLLGVIGVVLAFVFKTIERRVLSWYLRIRQTQRKAWPMTTTPVNPDASRNRERAGADPDRPTLSVEHVQKTYRSKDRSVEAIRDLDFKVNAGELVCVVGPSGAGKTTLLRCIAGLLPVSGGAVVFEGSKVT